MKRLAFAGAALVAVVAAERNAEACGGCFNPPETPTVVTDHKMVFSISKDQSTLYDQIRYTGAPESFAWVLPFAGDIDVGVSSDVLFSVIDGLTQTQILPPAQNCPPQPTNCRGFFSDAAAAGGFGPTGGIDVLKREVVGPYDTVQLKATDPKSLNDWLAQNGYVLPEDVKPVVAAYQAEHFNFLALKLIPGAGVQEMRPIRVTTKGSNVALPLRMVAAGTGPKVGITLWVFAEGRYEPTNFSSFKIDVDELAWDWTQNKSNYVDLRTQKNAAGNGRVWEVESSTVQPRDQIGNAVRRGGLFNRFGGGFPTADAAAAYLPEIVDGGVTATAEEVREEDIDVLYAGLPSTSTRVTRLRADLDHAALDHDLLLGAGPDQNVLATVRQVAKELNEPQCPVWRGCDQVGSAPRSQAAAQSSGDDDDGCAASGRHATSTWLAVLAGFFAFSLNRKFRRRR